MGRDMNQGQFAGGQNFMGQGNNQMQGQMQGHQMPGQQGRENQFGLPGERNQGMNQQNVQAGQQHPNQGGLNNQQSLAGDRNLGNADNRGPQSHADVGSYGYGMEGGYGGNDFNQWQNSGPMQGQGPDFRGNQQFYGGDDSSQGQFPHQQRGQRPNQFGPNATGRDGQVPPNQVPFSGQGGEAMPKSDNFGFNQQGGFGQEGIQPNADSTGRFPMRGGRPGPLDVNRGGLLPHPVMPGQTDDLTGGRIPDPQGQIPSRPGPGSRGTPDALVRPPVTGRPDPQPLMDQWPSMPKGQEQGRIGAHGEESAPPEGFPPRREGFPPRGGLQQGDFPGAPRGRGMLPTPDMPPQGQQPGYSNEPVHDIDAMEQGQWPGYDGDDHMDRAGAPGERGMEPSRGMRLDPDLRPLEHGRNHGQFRDGGDSDFRGAPQVGGRPFEGPVAGRPHDGPRDLFDGPRDRRSLERGPDGRPLDRALDRGPDGRPLLRGPDGRPRDRDPDLRPLEGAPDVRPFERGLDGKSMERDLVGRPLDGAPFERGPDRRSLERGQDRGSLERGPDGRPLDRPLDRGPDGRSFERGPDRRPHSGGVEGRPFSGRDGRFEGEGGFEPGMRFDGGGGRFDGPPDHRFPQHEEYNPMDVEYDPEGYEDTSMRGPHDRAFPGPRDFEGPSREFGGRGRAGRVGPDGRSEGPRNRGGFDRGRGRGFGRDFPPRNHHQEEGYHDYPMDEGFEGRGFDDMPPEDMHGFVQDFGNEYPGNRDFDSRRNSGRGRGDADRGRGGRLDGHGPRGRMDGPRGFGDRGRGRFDSGPDMDMDRRRGGPIREDVDSRSRDRAWVNSTDEFRGTGKGLLGDAPVGLLPAPPPKKEEDKDSRPLHQKDNDFQRDRDRRGHSARRDREDRDRGRDDRYGRRSDRRRSRDRSADRDRHSRRSDRDRDRSDRRDRDRDRDKERDRSSTARDRDSRPKDSSSKDMSTKDPSNGKKEAEKDSGKTDKKPDDHKKPSTDSPQTSESKYVHVKGFPTSYNYREIRRFFFGCELPFDGIKIINNIHGQRTGEVYLKFINEESAKRAMKKTGETIFGNPVTLTVTTSKVFESQVDSQTPPASADPEKKPAGPPPVVKKEQEKSSLIVMIRGLPFNIKREDLVNFFSSVKIADNGDAVFIEYDSRNQATGVAYLEAATVQDFKTAMGYDGRLLGARALKLSIGRREDMDICIKKQQEMFQRQANRAGDQQMPPQPSTGPGVMGARPPLIGQAPTRPGPQPLLNLNPMNMPLMPPRNGPAFDPNIALQRQQQQQLQQQQQGDKPLLDQGPSYCVHIQGLPMLASYKDIREFFGGLEIVTHRGIQIVHDGAGKPMGEGFVEFVSQEDKDKALKKDKTSMGRHILAVKSVAKADMIERLRNARFVGMPPGQGPPGQPNFPSPRPLEPSGGSVKPIPPGVLNRQWCYLSCQNFPPAVSITEIMNFFQNHNPIAESIRLHYAADGSPTGNAVVGFAKMEDANRALQDLNGKLCRRSMVILMPAM